jgi:hypothetical protein
VRFVAKQLSCLIGVNLGLGVTARTERKSSDKAVDERSRALRRSLAQRQRGATPAGRALIVFVVFSCQPGHNAK